MDSGGNSTTPGQPGTPHEARPAAEDAGFRPWHFFVLASLMAATVTVVLSRDSTPEHLVLISLAIGAAGLAAAGFYRALAPLAARDLSQFAEPLTDRTRALLEREKMLTLRSIKELEFDRAMGKVSAKDFDEMAGRLRARAMALMRQLESRDGTHYRPVIERDLRARLERPRTVAPDAAVPQMVSRGCPACGTVNDADATFCKRCGKRVVESVE